MFNIPDCTQPFIVDIYTDNADDIMGMMGSTAMPNALRSRGKSFLTFMKLKRLCVPLG